MKIRDILFIVLPMVPSLGILGGLLHGEQAHLGVVKEQLAISFGISLLGFVLTSFLVPLIARYTLKKGISGRDMGKKGIPSLAEKLVPEALGLVPGTVYIICAIILQLCFALTDRERMIYNSALFSVCFMVFLGFCDDTLDLAWRYKLILPTIASLPLLTSYSGSTAIYIPSPLQNLLMKDYQYTTLGYTINSFVDVDSEANGAIVELGKLFLLFMSLLSVFCTNSINILAGINGLECGQSYVIACSILYFKLYDIYYLGNSGENQLFAIVMILPFIGVSLGLLHHNWYPSSVFVGDTFCYFAGMTFAVVGIHGHFSKTLLLLFLPQIVNFVYSIPQLFKIIPCPRHRLPHVDPSTQLLHYSVFVCKKHEYKLFKVHIDDTECPNCTLLCLVLRFFGPMHEKTLCMTMMTIQMASTLIAFIVRYALF